MARLANGIAFACMFALLASMAYAEQSFEVSHGEAGEVLNKLAGTTTFELNGETWMVVEDSQSKKSFYFNKAKNAAQWEDPRESGAIPDEPLVEGPKASPLSLAFIVTVPVILFVGAMAGRIYYLHTNYPELLWPTKERRDRRRNNMKFKPQKARGKMSQDGKGGRSANS
mmetsp:Transcript_40280/g.89458  ORF Transcript_40280/g.89458 Transcript_40280/m.89458 type:complete len:170 (+) Transcript_40280:143-652(+)|eukprot:CAMPEP_0202900406 /NCGR_PEP_ID=MMETSP1392-20130828/11517_1 /ASSEMBLY_ACC=CAM_ASM_000868 /TAXON_ID=225041 /ORGANISM="Chlamydomonas chlamydogama, Strain SAG 11-48b" /LENGTH=169 /DNA_ID=CAMNT_0049586787 /DNA_START=138 /DNA_END=647 /DNA_ORIENTATION=+